MLMENNLLRLSKKETNLLLKLLIKADKDKNLVNDTCKLFKYLVDVKISEQEKHKVLDDLQ